MDLQSGLRAEIFFGRLPYRKLNGENFAFGGEKVRFLFYLLNIAYLILFSFPKNLQFKLHVISGPDIYFFIPFLETLIVFNFFLNIFFIIFTLARFYQVALDFGLLTAVFSSIPDAQERHTPRLGIFPYLKYLFK